MIHLTREVRFSVDLSPLGDEGSGARVGNTWAGWPAAMGLAPYLKLQATLAGEPDPVTGYLCDVKVLDNLIRACAVPLALRLVAEHGPRVLAEQLLRAAWDRLPAALPAGLALTRLRLLATPYIRYTVHMGRPELIHLTEQFEFSAAHRLHCPQLTENQNRATFGKCNNPNGHGHNYVVEVTVAGALDPATGLLCTRRQLEQAVRQRVLDRFDHRHLNEDTAEFRDLNPTVENIARTVWRLLDGQLGAARLERVRVYETPKTWADCTGA